MFKINQKAAVQFILVLAAAAALKQFYSTASANELRWILWPTARLTELVTGTHFTFEPYAGYMSSDRGFLIASACAGINFLIAAFLMLSLRMLWNERTNGIKWRSFVITAVSAFVVTIIANMVRIASALWLNASRPTIAGLDRDEIHRLDGIFVYFGFLLLLVVVSDKLISRSKTGIQTYLVPLGIYYLMTLAVPIGNGALRQGLVFWQHAAFVLVTPILLIVVAAVPFELFLRYLKCKDVAAGGSLFPNDAPANEIRTRTDIRDAAAFSHRTIGLKCGAVVADR
jgi:exosortase K